MSTLGEVIHNALVEIDMGGETLLSQVIVGNSETDETISSESGEAVIDNGPWALQKLAQVLDVVEKDHVYKAIIADYQRAQTAAKRLAPYVQQLLAKRPDLFGEKPPTDRQAVG